MKKSKPSFKILKIVDNPDGSATLHFEVNEDFIAAYLKYTGKKVATKAGVSKWVSKAIKSGIGLYKDA